MKHKAIRECSGMVHAGGAFWAHSDSGGEAVLYRSATLDFTRTETLEVPGAENVDWEDLAAIDGDILVCDIGDNARRRESVKVYRVRYSPACASGPGRLKLIATYVIQYPDGPHDAEAAFVADGKLCLVIKRRGEPATTVYRLDELHDIWGEGVRVNRAVVAGELQVGKKEQITGADCDPETGAIVLLSYDHLYRYAKGRYWGAPESKLRIRAGQCESVCIKGRQVILTNEQRGAFVVDNFLSP
jgi:hypothetical protein